MKLCAICDRDRSRLEQAQSDFPGINVYSDTEQLYADPEIDFITVATPNFSHCGLVLEALRNGKDVLVENAMCLNVEQADEMVKAAEESGRLLAVHHNRRYDGNYRRIKEIVDGGRIGDVFHIELTHAKYRDPFAHIRGSWWEDKERSGGSFFYYGPQAIDWLLDLVPYSIEGVTGFIHDKLVWQEMSDEDQVRAIIQFENGVTAEFTESHIDAAPKPFWRILGTKGAIVDYGLNAIEGYQQHISAPSTGSLELTTITEDGAVTQSVPYLDSIWYQFYEDVAESLLNGRNLPVDGVCGRRVMGVIDAAKKSARTGQTEQAPFK